MTIKVFISCATSLFRSSLYSGRRLYFLTSTEPTFNQLCAFSKSDYSSSIVTIRKLNAMSNQQSTSIKDEKSRNAFVKHLDSPEFNSLFSSGLKQLQLLFKNNNFELRLCGGAVRDLLLGIKPKDLDFATVATPDQMITMFKKENIRLINETGWGHGTVTCRIEEENFEITTLRIDRVTDGRRAIVEFTTDWKIDASRRDLTINSMFLTMSGDVIDFFNGVEDLNNKIVRFVGDAKTRITEDYLRILRYFRFFGRIADAGSKFDEDTLNTITENISGLNQVAGERIHTELVLIFTGEHVVEIVKAMHSCGLFDVVGLPKDADLDEFEKIYNSSKHLNPHHMTSVTALLPSENALNTYHRRMKFSNLDLNIARFIIQYRSHVEPCDKFAWYTDILVDYDRQFKHKGNINYFMEFLKYKGDIEACEHFVNFCVPKFPVKGYNLKEKTGAKGKDIGKIMELLFCRWRESRYALTELQLLENVDKNTLQELNAKRQNND